MALQPIADEQALLRILAQSPQGQGRVVLDPHPALFETFQACLLAGWAEEARFEAVRVWKISPSGRELFLILEAEKKHPPSEC